MSGVGVSGKRVMAIYGHPDDEGQATGTLASFVDEGNEVTLVCATRGEVGEISDPALATPETLPYTRELELRAAMAQIGIADVRFLGFRDSGMDGTPENEDPRAFHQQSDGVAVAAILSIMRDVRPHFVFTWQEDGGYGHPDHIAAHRHTLAAFDVCGDPTQYPEAGEAWNPAALYWSARSMKRFAELRLELERRGLIDDEEIDEETRARWAEMLERPEPPVSVTIDCRQWVERKRLAASMHRTQFGGGAGFFSRIPPEMLEDVFGTEQFYRARPACSDGATPLSSFSGEDGGTA